ncbi:hypothetical protein EV702DRAFT_1279167 [Suillus placidus]|uniref:Uncharacterized protein n=1 Tax=Suillus placidus TaxID=48579 RepID=A0A9P6ZU07_9AGAM|nr:hypothetical protein EV702DRAFT_1279167 [Suillus placidus]
MFGQRGSSSTDDQHTHVLSRDQRRVRSARLEFDRQSTHSPTVKGSATRSVSEARARQRINTVTRCQGISDAFGQRGSSSTEDQHTHNLSRDQRRVRSARLEPDRGSTHSQSVKGSATRSVSEARARQRINTLTSCQEISDAFGQRGSSSTEDQHTHRLSRDKRRVLSARLELDRGSTHSPTVKGLATRLVSEARARQRINTLTNCQGISDAFGQRGSSSTEDQHTHVLSRDQRRVQDQRRVRSARPELDRRSTHSPSVKGPAAHSVSEAQARQRINTLTSCQGISDAFGQQGSSSTEDQHTHILSRDQRRVLSARLELDRGSTHSRPVKGPATRSVSEARARQRINTLTDYQGISDAFCQRGSSSTDDQYTHPLSRNQRRVLSARLELDRGSTHSRPVKGSARLELDRGSTHSQTVKGSAMRSVSEARARQRINTLTDCQGISDAFGQRGSSSTEDQHTHSLSRDQ